MDFKNFSVVEVLAYASMSFGGGRAASMLHLYVYICSVAVATLVFDRGKWQPLKFVVMTYVQQASFCFGYLLLHTVCTQIMNSNVIFKGLP